MKIGIIGTSGRRDDAAKLTRELYDLAYSKLLEVLEAVPLDQREIVSGGAAWMDHLAVRLYGNVALATLELHLPCGWNSQERCFHTRAYRRASQGGSEDPGQVLNNYHRAFGEAIGRDTLDDLEQIRSTGVPFTVCDGFHARNRLVGEVDWLIAFTFAPGDRPPSDGGTRHCWDHSRAPRKTHISLEALPPPGTP